jgi:ABC-type Fe3+-hydroxamate transport system substrate-binding protein
MPVFAFTIYFKERVTFMWKKLLLTTMCALLLFSLLTGCQNNASPANTDPAAETGDLPSGGAGNQPGERDDRDLFGDTIDPMDRVRLSADGTYRVGIDYGGNYVRLPMPEDINRVVVVDNSSNQTMVMLGAKDKIIGTTVNVSMAEWHRKVHPEITEIYITNAEGSYNIEEIMNLEPDLIITSGQDDWEMFTEAGFTVIDMGNNNYDEMKQTATFLGDVLGSTHATKAKEFSDYVDRNIAIVTKVSSSSYSSIVNLGFLPQQESEVVPTFQILVVGQRINITPS